MGKHLTSQRFVYKIHSSRLRRAKWDLNLSISQARDNNELIALSESQMMRFIDELNGINNTEFQISKIKSKIKRLKKEKNVSISRPKIRKLYNELDKYQFKKDYVCVVIDRNQDYYKMYKDGFKINNITYRRLLGTTGGVKNNTIVFVNEELQPELKRRLDNGRDKSKEFVPAKLEAYYALACSSSTPVSYPHGIAVVHDCITHFKADVIELDDTNSDEPEMKHIKSRDMELNDSDGYGMATPELMERWGQEIGEDFLLPACVIRNSFCKGSVVPIDFRGFGRKHNISTITDVWGYTHMIDDIELIITESMLKLWDSYSSIYDYLDNCKKNKYTFAITKASEENLENTRNMNYQFLQSYDLSDEEIKELVKPTVEEINDILSDDYRKMILYTKGVNLNEKNVQYLDNSFATALMIEPEMKNDPYVREQIFSMIRKRINDAKVGVLKVPANYSFVIGDPYSLCQSMFGLEVTGLLKAGEVYSKYWIDRKIEKIVSFRAPMTSHNNIRLLKVVHNEEMDEFYKYMTTPTIFNSWDTCADAMNGFDKDGDCVINTSFQLLIDKTKELPAIVCIQRKAPKCIPEEDDLMESNIKSFGNAVGAVTNKITSMFEVQARYEKGTKEYNTLDYRIKCGQLFQQNQIDKTKGIVAKDMPATWYSWIVNRIPKSLSEKKDRSKEEDEEIKTKEFNRSILADKKPYFMKYIYPSENKKINEYIRDSNEKCIMRFRCTIKELMSKKEKSKEEDNFLRYYYEMMPLGIAPCTINKICWEIESNFDHIVFSKQNSFDHTILKCNVEYTKDLYNKIKKIYDEYRRDVSSYMQYAKSERLHTDERQIQKYLLKEKFKRSCLEQCPNEDVLCNIVLDLCYSKSKNSKQFAWDVSGDVFIRNLLKRHNYIIKIPVLNEKGEIEFDGQKFSMKEVKINHETDPEEELNANSIE